MSGLITLNYNQAELDAAAEEEREKQQLELDLIQLGHDRQIESLQKEIDLLRYYVLRRRAQALGMELEDPASVFRQDIMSIVLEPRNGHDCRKSACAQLHPEKGQRLEHGLTGETVYASGLVYMCSFTATEHICWPGHCKLTAVNRDERTDGFYCSLTRVYKHPVRTAVPTYDAKRPVGRKTIDQQEDAEHDNLGDYAESNFDMDDDDGWMDDGDFMTSFRDTEFLVERAQQAPKRVRVAKSTEERIQAHISALGEKRVMAMSIAKMLLDPHNQMRLHRARMYELGDKANHRLDSERGKAKLDLSMIECNERWLRYACENAPRKPVFQCTRACKRGGDDGDGGDDVCLGCVNYTSYANAIMRIWVHIIQSPYARKTHGPKQKPLHFEKIAFSIMYLLCHGDYIFNCSLSREQLAGCESLPQYKLMLGFGVRMITKDPYIKTLMPEPEDIVDLSRYTSTNARPEDNTIFEGTKLLKLCLNSIFETLRADLIEALAGEGDKEELLQTYIDECVSKKIPPTHVMP